MKTSAKLLIFLALTCVAAACGVKTDLKPVNQKQEQVGLQKFKDFKEKHSGKSITKY